MSDQFGHDAETRLTRNTGYLDEPALCLLGAASPILGFGNLDRLNRALDLACPTEDTVLLSGRIGFPVRRRCLTTIIGNALVHLLLFAWKLHPVEHVDRADGYADTVRDANVEVHTHVTPVDPILFTYSVLVEDLVLNMRLFCRPLIWKTSVLDELPNVPIRQG